MIAISRSSGVSLTVNSHSHLSSRCVIIANSLLSPTLKTGNPHGASSYVDGNDSASARMRSEAHVMMQLCRFGVHGAGNRRGEGDKEETWVRASGTS